jgi:LysM repeat protein
VALTVLKQVSRKTVKKLNPFSGPGSLRPEGQQTRREKFKVVVWTIVAANVVLFAGLLIQGCRGEPATTETTGDSAAEVTSPNTNGATAAEQKPAADSSVPPTFESTPSNTNPVPNTVAEAPTVPTPAPAQVAARQYAILKGDSFYKIARANGVSLKALTDANPGVNSAKLKVGQVLQLPVGAEPSATVSTSVPAPASATASQPTVTGSKAQKHYVVKSGDTLGRIARTHGTTVRAIKAANGLTSDRVVLGQNLKLPESGAARKSGTRA